MEQGRAQPRVLGSLQISGCGGNGGTSRGSFMGSRRKSRLLRAGHWVGGQEGWMGTGGRVACAWGGSCLPMGVVGTLSGLGRGCREGSGGCRRGGGCSPTLASSTFSRSVSSNTLLQLAQPVGGRGLGLGLGLGVPGFPWSLTAPRGRMEDVNRHLMTPTNEIPPHREGAAENSLSEVDHAPQVSPRAGPGN